MTNIFLFLFIYSKYAMLFSSTNDINIDAFGSEKNHLSIIDISELNISYIFGVSYHYVPKKSLPKYMQKQFKKSVLFCGNIHLSLFTEENEKVYDDASPKKYRIDILNMIEKKILSIFDGILRIDVSEKENVDFYEVSTKKRTKYRLFKMRINKYIKEPPLSFMDMYVFQRINSIFLIPNRPKLIQYQKNKAKKSNIMQILIGKLNAFKKYLNPKKYEKILKDVPILNIFHEDPKENYRKFIEMKKTYRCVLFHCSDFASKMKNLTHLLRKHVYIFIDDLDLYVFASDAVSKTAYCQYGNVLNSNVPIIKNIEKKTEVSKIDELNTYKRGSDGDTSYFEARDRISRDKVASFLISVSVVSDEDVMYEYIKMYKKGNVNKEVLYRNEKPYRIISIQFANEEEFESMDAPKLRKTFHDVWSYILQKYIKDIDKYSDTFFLFTTEDTDAISFGIYKDVVFLPTHKSTVKKYGDGMRLFLYPKELDSVGNSDRVSKIPLHIGNQKTDDA